MNLDVIFLNIYKYQKWKNRNLIDELINYNSYFTYFTKHILHVLKNIFCVFFSQAPNTLETATSRYAARQPSPPSTTTQPWLWCRCSGQPHRASPPRLMVSTTMVVIGQPLRASPLRLIVSTTMVVVGQPYRDSPPWLMVSTTVVLDL